MIKSDLTYIDNLRDENIDYSDIPELSDDQLSNMKPLGDIFPELVMDTEAQHEVTIPLDKDVLTYFETQASVSRTNYLTLINTVLKNYVVDQRVGSTSAA